MGAVSAGFCALVLLDSPALASEQPRRPGTAPNVSLLGDADSALSDVEDLIGRLVAGRDPAGAETEEDPTGRESRAPGHRPGPTPPVGSGEARRVQSGGDRIARPGAVPETRRVHFGDARPATTARPARQPAAAVDATPPTRSPRPPLHVVGAVPVTVRAITSVVTGLPSMVPGPVGDLLDPIVVLADRLLGTLLPPAAVCPVDTDPVGTPVPLPGVPGSEIRGGAEQGQATPEPPSPALARSAWRLSWPPTDPPRTPASRGAVDGTAVIGPAGPSPPGTPDRPGSTDHLTLAAERGTGPGPMMHQDGCRPPVTAAVGPVAHRPIPVIGRVCAVVARPG